MHILHLIKSSHGASFALNMISTFKERFPEVSHSVLVPPGGKNYKRYISVCKNVYDFDFQINHNIVKRGLQLRNIIKNEKPDIIHSWFTQTTLYARLFLRDIKTPRLFQVVGPLHLESPLYKFFDIHSAQKNDYWKATSVYIQNKYIDSGVPSEKLFVNHIPIDLNELLKQKRQSSVLNLRKQFNLSDDVKIIGAASYMYPPKLFKKAGVKNHEMLLQVFQELLNRRSDVVLVIGGSTLGSDKTYENELRVKAAKISREKIIFTGFVPNLGRLISEYDVFVFLSLSENLGGVYESLLYKAPTVASDRGAIPELVINGETGFTCNLKSITEIADKIEILLENSQLREKFKENGFAKVMNTFDKEKSIARSYKIYQEILKKQVLAD